MNGESEIQALLAYLRVSLGTGQSPDVGDVDWKLLLNQARRHHVLPLFHQGVQQCAQVQPPADIRASLSAEFTANLKRNMRISHHATMILEAFNRERIEIIPWKGVFLAHQEYGQLSRREVNDVDLLVAPANFDQATSILNTMGFESIEELDQQRVLRDSRLQIEIDLHRAATPDFFPVGFGFDDIRQGAQAAELGGQGYLSPGDGALVLLLCVQVAKDAWERLQRVEQLQKLCDLVQVIQNRPELDWNKTLESAAELGLRRLVLTVLLLAAELLSMPLPASVTAAANSDPRARQMALRLADYQTLADPQPAPAQNDRMDIPLRLRQLRFYLGLRERWSDRRAHLGQVLRAMTGGPVSG